MLIIGNVRVIEININQLVLMTMGSFFLDPTQLTLSEAITAPQTHTCNIPSSLKIDCFERI